MRSIRLSLVVYFLLLLAVGLGAVSYLFYRSTARTLREKQETNRQLLRTQYDDRRRDEMEKVDTELVHQAFTLANLAQARFEANRLLHLSVAPTAGVLSMAAADTPSLYALIPGWFAETHNEHVSWRVGRLMATTIDLYGSLPPGDPTRSADFYQIDSFGARRFKSESLGDGSLPFNREHFAGMALLATSFEDFEFNGQHLRGVKLRAPLMRSRFLPPTVELPTVGPPGARAGQSRPGDRPNNRPPRRPDPPPNFDPPSFYIQCANDTGHRDQILGGMEADLQQELEDLDTKSREALGSMRRNLVLIDLATFAAVCIGASLLIGLGLAPLRRLSEAVSHVSEKDIELHYDGPPPPREVEPIIERLKQTLKMLQHAFDREKQATSDISHELRTPLAAMLTTLEVSLRKPRSAEEYRETLAECRDLVKQMTQLVERLLTLTWLDARSDRLRHEAVDAGDVADQCAALVRPLARANGLKLEVHRESPVLLTTDPDKLREVIANLMHNAIEYNRPAGSVDVSVRPAGTGLDLEVRDTGIGIAAEHRDHIFERFYRADPSRQATGLHAGLGLAIVRGYVELMGGTISVESEPGQGSTFRVRIPSAENGTNS